VQVPIVGPANGDARGHGKNRLVVSNHRIRSEANAGSRRRTTATCRRQ
jgi:hypothetical protein